MHFAVEPSYMFRNNLAVNTDYFRKQLISFVMEMSFFFCVTWKLNFVMEMSFFLCDVEIEFCNGDELFFCVT
jgi:hypothetical protein